MLDGDLHPDSLLVSAGRPAGPGDPLNHGIVAASNYRPGGERWYARSDGTATVAALEDLIGRLEGGRAVAFASGMAACAAALATLPAGAAVAHSADLYHGVGELLAEAAGRGAIEKVVIAPDDLPAWTAAAHDCELLWIESPTNPLLEIADLSEICGLRDRSALIVVDSTFATPLGQHPLRLGADMVVHSATKFIGGHSDLVAGIFVSARTDLVDAVLRHRTIHGAVPGALESYLALRGARTLGLRLERATANASELAVRLALHPLVERVRYPGLSAHPGHEAAARFMHGYGAILSFELSDDGLADRFLSGLSLVVHATSLGGVETTAERRSGYPGSDHIPAGLVRLSVGCEHIEDLWSDIDTALTAAAPAVDGAD